MIIVYDKDGNQSFHNHMIDAREAIATGRFFKTNPVINVAPVEKKQPKINKAPGEDISPAKFVDPAGFEVKEPISSPVDAGFETDEVKTPEFEHTKGRKKRG